ncbi:unnamed protein product [Urochloa humidicola]
MCLLLMKNDTAMKAQRKTKRSRLLITPRKVTAASMSRLSKMRAFLDSYSCQRRASITSGHTLKGIVVVVVVIVIIIIIIIIGKLTVHSQAVILDPCKAVCSAFPT